MFRYGVLQKSTTMSTAKLNDSKAFIVNHKRQRAVRDAMAHAWKGYTTFAFGKDELKPLSYSYSQRWGNWSISLVDALDTLYLFGMLDEYETAKKYVQNIDFGQSPIGHRVPVFEMTIRALGGLLGAYELDQDPMLLKKAQEVGDTLALAFDTPTGIPWPTIDLNNISSTGITDVCIAEAGSLQLEFAKLSELTGNPKYRTLADRASEALEKAERQHQGLYPTFINVETGKYNTVFPYSAGARADSFYEYLLKQYILHGGREQKYKEQYITATEAIVDNLVRKSHRGMTFIGSMSSTGEFYREMEHLACFYPGLLALGAQVTGRKQDLDLAEKLTRTCYLSYKLMASGLGPEIFSFPESSTNVHNLESYSEELGATIVDARYLLRPETLESIFLLYRATGNRKYQDWGWSIFESIERYTKVNGGYAAMLDVRKPNAPNNLNDSMESFFLAETLKYLYLLFSSVDLIPLDKYVLNTEAHPLRVITV
ncbi:Endoplasmic reticulum mannosyl-oligosaccharide 1,2-alpha-mannosidase [Coemansia sp. RSA 988]|nr:Endoplasmic reticulum mannosyl-oligosaccharide 1,2-alpha-mannosidase [Coemansia sp. RSA 988]